MYKFKIGDKVKLVGVGGCYGEWETSSRGKTGIIKTYSQVPWIKFDDGNTDCGSEDYLELVEEEKHMTEAEKRGAKFGTLGVMKDTGERCVYIADSLVLPRFWEIDVEGKADRWHRHPSQIRLDHEPEFIAWSDAPEDLKYDAHRVYYRDQPVKWIAKPEGIDSKIEWIAIVDNNGGPSFTVPKHLKVKV